MRLRFGTLCLVALVLLPGTSAFGQQARRGSIAGTIKDDTGAALPGVTVTVTSPALQVAQILRVSNERGDYQITELPPGTYRVSYELTGFATLVREGIALTTGFAARVDPVLQLATLAETVTVAGETPLVDLSTTRGGATVAQTLIREIPGNQNFQDVLMMVGGVSNPSPPKTGQISTTVNGFYGKAYGVGTGTALIEGVKMNANESPDFTTVEEVDVKTFGNTADVDAPGATVQLILKSGGNQFHGKVAEIAQHERFQAKNIDDRLRAQGLRLGDSIMYYNDIAADLGGRIIRDKLWFYGSARDFRNKSEAAGFVKDRGADGRYGTADDTPARMTPSHQSLTLKISYQATPKNRFTGYIQYNPDFWSLGQSRFTPYESTLWLKQYSMEEKPIEWQSAISNRWLMTHMWGHGGYDAKRWYLGGWEPYSYEPSRQDRATGQVTGPSWDSGTARQNKPIRNQFSGSVNYLPAGSFGGSHAFQAGYRIWRGQQLYANPQDPDRNGGLAEYRLVYDTNYLPGAYVVPFNGGLAQPVQLITRNYRVEGVSKNNNYAWYLMDSWRPTTRLTLNLGIRWERQTHYVPAQVKAQGTFGVSGTFPPVDAGKWTEWAPRAGVAFDLTGDGKTVVKGTFGRFNEDLGVNGYAAQFNANSLVDTTYRWSDVTRCNCFAPGSLNLSPTGPDFLGITGVNSNALNPDLRLQYINEATASVERELGSGMSVRGVYVYKKVIDSMTAGLIATSNFVNVLRPYSYFDQAFTRRDPGPDGVVGNADDGGTITIYDYNPAYRSGAFVKNMIVNADADRRDTYNNFEVALSKRPTGMWYANTSLLATKNYQWIVKNLLSPNDLVHAVNDTWDISYTLAGGVNLPSNMSVSTLYQGYNGLQRQRTNIFRAVDPSGGPSFPSSSSITQRMEPFGAQRGPARHIVNLRFAKDFRFGGSRQIKTSIDAFNAFNTNVPWGGAGGPVGGGANSGITDASGSTYGYTVQIVSPRVLRFNVGYEF